MKMLLEGERSVVIRAPINMALVKYWGKRCPTLMLPLNDSLSITIDSLCATTIQNPPVSYDVSTPFVNFVARDLTTIRNKTGIHLSGFVRSQIESTTNFPVEAGLASSAAGFAALVYGLGKVFDLSEAQMWQVARFGSGSACRSMLPGFTHWIAGNLDDGSDCTYDTMQQQWPQLTVVVAVTSTVSKAIGSTEGMALSVQTSELLKYRVSDCVSKHITKLKRAIKDQDFAMFGSVVMKESNQLHAICLDTQPPLFYLSQHSIHLINIVTAFNKLKGDVRVAYTFDAGPNCCMFMLRETVTEFMQHLTFHCGKTSIEPDFIRGNIDMDLTNNIENALENTPIMSDSVEYCFISTLGIGPQVIVDKT